MPHSPLSNLVLRTDDGMSVRLGRELGSGGEAAVYEVANATGYVAKIYRDDDPAKLSLILREKEPKVRAMLSSAPQIHGRHCAIAWPATTLRNSCGFAGFLMRRAEGKILFMYHNPRQRHKLSPNFDWRYLHRTAFNLSVIVDAIHQAGHVIADVNDQNFLVQDTTLVAAVDTDSYQIRAAGGGWHLCGVGRPFTPPELQGKSFAEHPRSAEQDLFGLGVMVFLLLMEGSHPFRAKLNLSHSVPEAQLYCIQHGHFPYDRRQGNPAQPPPGAVDMAILDPLLQNLFRRCFVDGQTRPDSRPKAREWRDGLRDAEQRLIPCRQGHHRREGLSECPWCARALSLQVARAADSRRRVPQRNRILVPARPANGNWRTPTPARARGPQPRLRPYRHQLGLRLPSAPRIRSRLLFFPSRFPSFEFMARIAVGIFVMLLVMGFFHKPAAPSITPVGEPLKHDGKVTSAAFSPDGTKVLTLCVNRHAQIWDVATGKEMGPALGHGLPLNSAAFSPDGLRVITGSSDSSARVWNVLTGQLAFPPLKHGDWVMSAAFSPDGRRIVTASYDRTARVWDAATGLPAGQPMKLQKQLTSASFSPDGRRVLTTSLDTKAQVWVVASGQPLGWPLTHQDRVTSAVFSPNGRWVLTGSSDKTAKLWDGITGESVGLPFEHGWPVTAVSFSPNGRQVLTVGGDTARVWHVDGSRKTYRVLRHLDRVTSAAFSPDGTLIVTSSLDNTACLWNSDTGEAVGQPMRHDGMVASAAFSPDGLRVVTASADRTARIWALSSVMDHSELATSLPEANDGTIPYLATREHPFINSLGLQFIPIPGQPGVLMCRTDARVVDFQAYTHAIGYVQRGGIYVAKTAQGSNGNFSTYEEADSAASWAEPGFPQGNVQPVVGVSWSEANYFCQWLSQKEDRNYRLPTDEEWTAAAGPDKYPWGEEWPPPKGAGNYFGIEGSQGWPGRDWAAAYTYDDGYRRTSPAGKFRENLFGFFDMGGNVWQWCEDVYKPSMNTNDALEKFPYLQKETSGNGTPMRVLRGGSWYSVSEMHLRTSFHEADAPTIRQDDRGFRCVLVFARGLMVR